MKVLRLFAPFPTFRLLLLLYLGHFFDAFYFIRPCLPEALEINPFYEDWQRRLPWLLLVICDLAQLLRIHTNFPCHLDIGMRKMVPLTSIYPGLVFLLKFCLLWHLLAFCFTPARFPLPKDPKRPEVFEIMPLHKSPCAHEVGHWVLHRQYVDVQGRLGSKNEAIVCRLKDVKEPIEWQADCFAACLLMPEEEIREAFQKVCGQEPLVLDNVRGALGRGSRYVEPCIEHWPFIAAAMCEAGGFSNVSKQAMVIRLQELGLLINLTAVRVNWQALCSNA